MTEIQDAINSLKANFDAVQQSLQDAQARLAAVKAETVKAEEALAKTRQNHANLVAEADAKRVQAETAARENAKRIEVNNSQMAELLKVRSDVERRERTIEEHAKTVDAAAKKYAEELAKLHMREAAVSRKEEEINRRYAKMKEAVS